jgi:amino acid adenylation domain-containing protein
MTSSEIGTATVESRFRQWARVTPSTLALVDEKSQLSYAELDAETDALAARMCALGIGPEQVVAVKAARKLDAVIAMIAVQKAGGVYLPLESAAPVERARTILEDSRAAILFAGEGVDTDGLDIGKISWQPGMSEPTIPARQRPLPGNAAYIIYTSGTTGVPKGVCVQRDLLAEHLDAICAAFGLRSGDRILQFSPVHVDTAVEQALSALIIGATLVTIDEILSVSDFLSFLGRHRVTVAHIATGYWNVIVNTLEHKAWPNLALRQMIVGGERMYPDKAKLWRTATGVPLMNAYGPTETVITPTRAVVTDDDHDSIPIGTCVGERTAYVLDEDLRPCPDGVAGELYLGGRLLARGYLGRPGLTARAFIPDPFGNVPGARLYRTGDIVRKAGERLLYIGRRDNQLKVRGHRVELGEIETILGSHPDVRDVAVVARNDDAAGPILVAYIVSSGQPDQGALREHAAAALPGHMVPTRFSFLPALPMTNNNKIDRHALLGAGYRPSRPVRRGRGGPVT